MLCILDLFDPVCLGSMFALWARTESLDVFIVDDNCNPAIDDGPKYALFPSKQHIRVHYRIDWYHDRVGVYV
jgi:hypothetical protein